MGKNRDILKSCEILPKTFYAFLEILGNLPKNYWNFSPALDWILPNFANFDIFEISKGTKTVSESGQMDANFCVSNKTRPFFCTLVYWHNTYIGINAKNAWFRAS